MKRFQIDCGASQPSQHEAIAMDVAGPAGNVELRIDNITRPMLRNVPDILIDLLEVAAYIYCADQRLSRGSAMLTNFGEHWRRSLRFSIPVRHPEVWQQCDIQDCLEETLGFLSDDSYKFDFRKTAAPARLKDQYFPHFLDEPIENGQVALFSGGIDSFAGAVDDLVTQGKSVTLVGHSSSSKVRNIQQALIDGLKKRGFGRDIFYIPVWVTNRGVSAQEYTQRTRSFLFACLGLVIASMSGKSSFTFYENGVVSINPSLAGDIVGGRATRTTHPKVLRGLETMFSILLHRPITIRTPLQWLTKSEVVQKIGAAGMGDLLAMTNSCTRPRIWTRQQRHCGRCSQCIDRRFAIMAAGMEEFEPSENYMRDLLLGDRSADSDMRMALSYVSFVQKLGATSKERFLAEFPEIVSALDKFPDLTTAQVEHQLYELFQRHARSIEAVIASNVVKYSQALVRHEILPGSLLANCINHSQVEVIPASDYDGQTKAFIDQLTTPIFEFAIDAYGQKVLFRGGPVLDGANYKMVEVLLVDFRKAKARDVVVPFLPAATLADRMKISDQAMRRQLTRLRTAIEPLAVSIGIPLDQNSFIETKERLGYRLNPELREIAVADIRSGRPTPQVR